MTHDETSTLPSHGDTSSAPVPASEITTISPTTNKSILVRSSASTSDIAALAPASRQAFKAFRKSHPTLASRSTIITKALEIITSRTNDLSQELTEQMGRPIAYTPIEIKTAIKRAEYLISIAPEVLESSIPVLGQVEPGFKRYLQRHLPKGVILIIFAWNYPYLILMNSIIPAILAGNTVILKPSPQTPTIAEHVKSIFEEAGLPSTVIQYLHCGRVEDLAPLIQHVDVDHVCFTGSVAGGQAVQRLIASSPRSIQCTLGLELGGKDPAYIRSDVKDLKWAASEVVDGAIFNSGQSCCAIERVYVHTDVHDEFVKEVIEVLKGYKLGDPREQSTQIGPVVSQRAKTQIDEQIQDAMSKGAQNQTPPNDSFSASSNLPGNYVIPTLLTHTDHTMSIMHLETFGPVVPVMRVKSDEEAIHLMNDSNFGLTASIWTSDVEKGEELGQSVEAGTVFVNRADYPSPDLAWTGWKESGMGVTLGRFGFEQFVRVRSVHVKDYPVSK